MGRPRLARSVVWPALVAVSRGVPQGEAARAAGIAKSSLQLVLANEPVGVVHERKRRLDVLSLEEREEVRVGIERGESDTRIAVRLGRHRSTVWREIRLNGGRGRYRVFRAEDRAFVQACRPKPGWTVSRPEVWEVVQMLLRTRLWSPEGIARRLRREHPDEPHWWVSHEAIYQAIYVQACGELRKELVACLASRRPRRQPRTRASSSGTRGRIVGMVNIAERPPEAVDRGVPGHWEGDLIVGKDGKTAAATLVERSTRFGIIVQLDNKTAEHVTQRVGEAMSGLPTLLARSLTWDQGKELAAHHAFTVATGIPVYFCDPHSPWQRPSNENWNGKVRWFIPKGTSLANHTQDDYDRIATLINGRPRELLAWDTPAERFAELVAHTP
jgi:IS30 family transposase